MKKRVVAETVVRDADMGVGTLGALAGELGTHVADQTVYRRARVVGVGVNPPAWGDYDGKPTRWFVAAGRILLPFIATHRTWPELEVWASEQGWTIEDIRQLVGWLVTKNDAVLVREEGPRLPPIPDELADDRAGHIRWFVVASPDDIDEFVEADDTPIWARSLPAAVLRGAGHAPRQAR